MATDIGQPALGDAAVAAQATQDVVADGSGTEGLVTSGQAISGAVRGGHVSDETVEVRYAWPGQSWQAALVLQRPMSIGQVLGATGFHRAHPGWDAAIAGVGINGRLASLETLVQGGDRIEIYRPLSFDPMVSRRRRAQHKAKQIKKRQE